MKISAPGLTLSSAAPGASAFGDAAAAGTGVLASRADHKHSREATPLPAAGRLAADQAFNTNVTLADLTGLSVAVAANEECDIFALLLVTSGTGGVRFDVTGPAGATSVLIQAEGNDAAGTSHYSTYTNAFSIAMQLAGGASTGHIGEMVRIHLRNGANAGTVQLRGACWAAAGVTTFHEGSYLVKQRRAA